MDTPSMPAMPAIPPTMLTVRQRYLRSWLDEYVAQGWLTCRAHPRMERLIWNYTPKAQYERHWDEVTLACRGLITDGEGTVIARPFPKFFNLDEYALLFGPPPAEPFEVTEKYDGSLGISYLDEYGLPALATRGSFESEQAQVGTRLLRKAVASDWYDPAYTYLWEILYPANRIVVKYEETTLVLLAAIETATGQEHPHPDVILPGHCPFRLRQQHLDLTSMPQIIERVAETGWENREGLVLRFLPSNVRVKLKFAEYVRLHKLLTGITPHDIWERMATGTSLQPLYETVPDEFYAWVKGVARGLQTGYERLHQDVTQTYKRLMVETVVPMPFEVRDAQMSAQQFERLRQAMQKALAEQFALTPDIEHLLHRLYAHERKADIQRAMWLQLEPPRTLRSWTGDEGMGTGV